MKSNELMELIHSGEIKDNTKINVMTELGKFITTILYKNDRLEWKAGEFDTRYLCDIETEFELDEDDKIEEINTKGLYTGDRVSKIEDKLNEVIRKVNEISQK